MIVCSEVGCNRDSELYFRCIGMNFFLTVAIKDFEILES